MSEDNLNEMPGRVEEPVEAAPPTEPEEIPAASAETAPAEETALIAAEPAPEEPAATVSRQVPEAEPEVVTPPPTAAGEVETAGVAEEQMDMEQALEAVGDENYASSFPRFSRGEVIKGRVVHIDREGVLVDVGAKSEGIIKPGELSRDESAQAEDVVSVGEEIDVLVLDEDSADGSLLLSKKRADFEKAWERVIEAKETGKILHAMVTDRVRGGLVVDLGIRGFVPASHVWPGSGRGNLERYVGQSIPLKVLEVDKERYKVVLSHKEAYQEERQSRRHETLQTLKVGQECKGIVRRLTDYGAFVDIGGVDGLLHVSEMSWTRIKHPSEVLKEGDEIEVMILRLDLEAGKVSLGRRQLLPDPWREVDRIFKLGDVIKGTVERILAHGAFIKVKGGIEGFLPNSEVSYRRGVKITEVIQVGDEVEVKIIELRPEERRMTLSLRQARQEEENKRERKAVEEYQARSEREAPRYTIGDAVRAKEENNS